MHGVQRAALVDYATNKLSLTDVEVESARASDKANFGTKIEKKTLMQRAFADLSEVSSHAVVTGKDAEGKEQKYLLKVIDEALTQDVNLESAIIFAATTALAFVSIPVAVTVGIGATLVDIVPYLDRLAKKGKATPRQEAAAAIGLKHGITTLLAGTVAGPAGYGLKGIKGASAIIDGMQSGKLTGKRLLNALKSTVGVHAHHTPTADDLRIVQIAKE